MQQHNPNTTRGFTLIELMVVVSIIGILAAVAVPAYQSYIVRTKVAEATLMVNEAKPKVSEFYRSSGRLPADNASAGLPPGEQLHGNHVTAIHVEQGAIHVYYRLRSDAEEEILSYRPAINPSSPLSPIVWVCGDAKPPEALEVRGENATTAPRQSEYNLPRACRG